MGILWSLLCCKDGTEPIGPTLSHKRANSRMKKQQQAPPTPTWGPPSTPKDGSKRSKLLESGDNQATSYSSINGTGPPPKFSPVPDRHKDKDSKRPPWPKSHTFGGSDGDSHPGSPPSSPRDKKPRGPLARSFTVGMPGKQSSSDKPKRGGSFRLSKKK